MYIVLSINSYFTLMLKTTLFDRLFSLSLWFFFPMPKFEFFLFFFVLHCEGVFLVLYTVIYEHYIRDHCRGQLEGPLQFLLVANSVQDFFDVSFSAHILQLHVGDYSFLALIHTFPRTCFNFLIGQYNLRRLRIYFFSKINWYF